MACRVGITMDPDRRRAEWRRRYPSMFDWTIVATYYSKAAAQRAETNAAATQGCVASPGGGGPENAKWYLYRFYY